MPTIRSQHQRNYTVISNGAIQDTSISFLARGIHHLLLSYPDGWRVNAEHLHKQTTGEGKTRIKKALKELNEAGYVVNARIVSSETGRFLRWESVIREHPGAPGNLSLLDTEIDNEGVWLGLVASKAKQEHLDSDAAWDERIDDLPIPPEPPASGESSFTKNPETEKSSCSKIQMSENPPTGFSTPLISNKDNQVNNQQNDEVRRTSGNRTIFDKDAPGSESYMADRPWMKVYHRFRPSYDEGFLKYLLSTVGSYGCYNGEATIANMITWLNWGNGTWPDAEIRLSNIWARWEEFQKTQEEKAKPLTINQYQIRPPAENYAAHVERVKRLMAERDKKRSEV